MIDTQNSGYNINQSMGQWDLHFDLPITDSNVTHENIVKALLEHGADVNARGSGFETALHTAMYSGKF